MRKYHGLATERVNPKTTTIDTLDAGAILNVINQEDESAIRALKSGLSSIKRAVAMVVDAWRLGRRIFFVGAGTSGRLGVMEAAECPPTFHTPPARIQAIMAGGSKAVFRSQEGAEDDAFAGRRAVRLKIRPGDVVIGIAASGITPFVLAALKEARRRDCRVILVTCNSEFSARRSTFKIDVLISLNVGPEVIAGSTRLKAGTATKMALNMITTAAMVRLGKVYGNLMVDLEIKSNKLKERAIRIVQELTGLNRSQALRHLRLAKGRSKVAIVMAKKGVNRSQAIRLLSKHRHSLRSALT
ncbi:MAG: N-acetylmuramic acid 6-phosphate etherase [Elusimicrobia bacterium]|nr:N-acetylmuramic acid 6-phosphate etherase [Elusimicrobiota bacterium]